MPLSAVAQLYADENLGGTQTFHGLGHNERYRRVPLSALQEAGKPGGVRSALLHPTDDCDALLVLFGSTLFGGVSAVGHRFTGQFQQIGLPKGASDTAQMDYANPEGAASALLIATNRDSMEARLSLRRQLLNQWVSTIDAKLDGSRAVRDGEPIITWDPFPQDYLNPDTVYVRIRQNLKIEFSWWRDYEAWMQYHLRFFIDQEGTLHASVARWEYWVRGGTKSSSIAEELEPKVIEGMSTINAQLKEEIGAFSSFSFSDVYYLPGDQTLEGSSELQGNEFNDGVSIITGGAPSLQGATTQDVTLVLPLDW